MSEKPSSGFKKAVSGAVAVSLLATTASTPVSSNTPESHGKEKARVEESAEPATYTFGELWDRYWTLQSSDEIVKGKITDFDEYATTFSQGKGFDETDLDFDKKFHGNFFGYTPMLKDGVWVYTEDPVALD